MHVRYLSKRRRNATRVAALALIAGVALSASPSRAAMYSYFYATPSTNLTAMSGTNLRISVYLEEEANAGAPSASLINDDEGLYAGAFTATKTTGASTVFSVAANTLTPPDGFDGPNPTQSGGVVSELCDLASAAPDGVTSKMVNGAGFSGVLLGTVTVHVVGAAGTQTTFTLGPADGSSTNDTGYDLDDNTGFASLYDSAAPTTFKVTATAAAPEPASLAALAIAGVVLVRRRRA